MFFLESLNPSDTFTGFMVLSGMHWTLSISAMEGTREVVPVENTTDAY